MKVANVLLLFTVSALTAHFVDGYPISFPGPVVNPCQLIQCNVLWCKFSERLIKPKGECCPSCVPDCGNIMCAISHCNSSERLVVPDGECQCPVCCPRRECASDGHCPLGQKLIIPDGPCCASCEPGDPTVTTNPVRCTRLSCPYLVTCPQGEVLFHPAEEECSCPRCVPTVTESKKLCANIECESGEECQVIEKHAQCVTIENNSCASLNCPAGTVCSADSNGEGVCVIISLPKTIAPFPHPLPLGPDFVETQNPPTINSSESS